MAAGQNAFDMQIKLLMIGDSGKFSVPNHRSLTLVDVLRLDILLQVSERRVCC
jgi:hypothetical protein